MKQLVKSLYTSIPKPIKTRFYNLLNSDGFYTQKQQDLIDRITLLSQPIADRELQKRVVKENLLLVEIEIASFCNRACWFCPNSHISRRGECVELEENTYLKLLHNLAEISYDKDLNFHRFNEPMADMPLLLKRVRQARSLLPKARFTIFSNGDYATRENILSLREAGVDSMLMSYYYGREQPYSKSHFLPAMEKMREKLALPMHVVEDSLEEYRVRFELEGMELTYRVWNPQASGQSRGGSVAAMRRARRVDSGCFQGAMNFYVDYNGLVCPCCHTRSDLEAHRDFIVGDCKEADLFAIFCGESFARLRAGLFMSKPCSKSIERICADCSDRRREQFFFTAR